MKQVKVEEIVKATNGVLLCGQADSMIQNVIIDSREETEHALFVPIVGEKTDGHRYVSGAIEHGAKALFINHNTEYKETIIALAKEKEVAVIEVEHTIKALQQFASWYRSGFSIPVIGITGSVGKTTTKEMVASALETKKNVLKTIGNKNSQIGLPLMMFYLEDCHEVAVIEMGMSEVGEMKNLSFVAKPECAVMTNIGVAHIAQLGSQEAIRKEKLAIANEFLQGSALFINGNDRLLLETATQITQNEITIDCNEETKEALLKATPITYGIGEGFTYSAKQLVTTEKGINFVACYKENGMEVELPISLKVYGEHNVLNALSALAVAKYIGIDEKVAKQGLEQYEPIAMRGQIKEVNGVTWIDDTYNASPDSMKSGAKVLLSLVGKRRIAVFADVLELGEVSEQLHREVGAYLAQLKEQDRTVDILLTVGEQARFLGEEAKKQGLSSVFSFSSNEEASAYLKSLLQKGDVVLVKGSRGMKTEEIIKECCK